MDQVLEEDSHHLLKKEEEYSLKQHWSIGRPTNNVGRSSNQGCPVVKVQGMFKLQPIGNADAEIINEMGLSSELENMGSLEVLYECGICNIFLPRSEVPTGWRSSNKRMGSSLTFNVPSLPNLKIQALKIYVVFDDLRVVFDHLAWKFHCFVKEYDYITVNNVTKGVKWAYSPLFRCIPSGGMVPKMSDDLRSATTDEGDEVRDYDQGRTEETLLNSAEETGPSAELQSEPSTSLTQNQANPIIEARRTNNRQRRGRGRSSGQHRGRGLTGSNTYRAFFASEDAIRHFRESFQIPADVELELIPLDPGTHCLPQRHETVVPIFAICAAGLRFPIQTFTRQFLHVIDVTSGQLSLNTFRIINGIAELKRLHNLELP
ncbi:hypothetical protein Vadar_031367 [Vaccinium darrowii]|uniref:Uncharacterized protein n=1 Tax=Vaccinium darrowii TaxID=229202 RepID=A0ACB7Y2Z3_9ERIC|nr:hypothetical protein Vadar_031367 [Vaccinium darrowii]